MVNSDRYAMMDASREVKTCFDLPTSNFIYSLVELSISTPTHLKDQNKVISIRDFDADEIPNRLKGINNLFSNYGNVKKVGILAKDRVCEVHFQTGIGADIALKQLSCLGKSIDGLNLMDMNIVCSSSYQSWSEFYTPDPRHARFKNKVPNTVNPPERTVHFSIFGLGEHIVTTKSLEKFVEQHCYPQRVKRESKDQNMWFVEL